MHVLEQPNPPLVAVQPDEVHISLQRALRRYDISRSTLDKWCRERGLKKAKLGKCTFFRTADLRILVEGAFPK